MAKGKDKNHVSFWFWMFALFITALPCIGTIMVIVWAFVGENRSRKNYFRAVIAWYLIITALWTAILVLGLWPTIYQHLQGWLRQLK